MSSQQPSSINCFVCGVKNPAGLRLRFFQSGPNEVVADVTIPEHYEGYPGIVHGGIIAALLDEAAGRTLMGDQDNPQFMFTGRLDIHYRKNVPTGKQLRLVGKSTKRRGRVAKADSAIYDQEGNVLAEAKAVLIDVPSSMIQNVDLESLGWKIYDE